MSDAWVVDTGVWRRAIIARNGSSLLGAVGALGCFAIPAVCDELLLMGIDIEPNAPDPGRAEVRDFVRSHRVTRREGHWESKARGREPRPLLFVGIGWVDAIILCAAFLRRTGLWSHDAKLLDAAEALGLSARADGAPEGLRRE